MTDSAEFGEGPTHIMPIGRVSFLSLGSVSVKLVVRDESHSPCSKLHLPIRMEGRDQTPFLFLFEGSMFQHRQNVKKEHEAFGHSPRYVVVSQVPELWLNFLLHKFLDAFSLHSRFVYAFCEKEILSVDVLLEDENNQIRC